MSRILYRGVFFSSKKYIGSFKWQDVFRTLDIEALNFWNTFILSSNQNGLAPYTLNRVVPCHKENDIVKNSVKSSPIPPHLHI